MKKQIFLITAFAALMTVSCTKSGMDTTDVNPDGQIKVKTTIANTTATKGLVVGETTALDKLAFVHAQLATAPAAGTPVDFSDMTPFGGTRAAGAESEVVFAPASKLLYQYDKADGKISYLMGYSPVEIAQSPSSNVVSWVVTGETDILVSELWNAGTYLVPATTPMTFKHVLARVEVILQSKTAKELLATQDTWGKITGVSFKKAFPKMTFNYATNQVAPGGGEVDKIDLPLLNGNTYTSGEFTPVDIAVTGSTTVMASAMVPPTGEASFTLVVSSEKMSDVEIPVTLTDPQATFIAGYGYTVTLNCGVSDKYITVASSVVTPWDETGSGSGNAELPKPEEVPVPTSVVLKHGVAPYGILIETGEGGGADPSSSIKVSTRTSYNDLCGHSMAETDGSNGPYVYPFRNGYQDVWDAEPPFYSFEIAKTDLSKSGGTVSTFEWTEAQGTTLENNLCFTTYGKGWRLPRISELVLMMANKAALDNYGNGFAPLTTDVYWSASQGWDNLAYFCDETLWFEAVIFDNACRVRCIREIPDGGAPVVPSAKPVILEYGVAPYDVQLLDWNDNDAVIDATKTSRNEWYGSGSTNGEYQENGGDMAVTWVAEKPYYKFEVAKRDLWWWDATGIRYVFTWTEAQGTTKGGLCAKTFGQGWRLPRLSELAVMIKNMAALAASGNGFIPLRKDSDNDGYEYWSATESSLTGAWYHDTDDYGESEKDKTEKGVVRCIRELP